MKNIIKIILSLILVLVAGPVISTPLGSGFTYQGELMMLGNPADGEFDFTFGLYDIDALGIPVATPLQIENLVVANGGFTVELDFGTNPFSGVQLWLEIGVRNGDSLAGFTLLAPRHKLTASPFALRAQKVFPDRLLPMR